MPDTSPIDSRGGLRVRLAWILAALLVATLITWSMTTPDASGSDVLIVIEDASPIPTGVFPGTVCYQLVRDHDDAVITQGCLKLAASISAPAGLDRSVLYTLHVTVNAPGCTLLHDDRNGSGFSPFRVRVSCEPLDDGRSAEPGDSANGESDATFGAASASPIALPDTSAP